MDLTRFAVVEPRVPTREATNSLVTLNADNIELAGLVLQGVHDDTPQLVTGINGEFTVFNPALSSSDDHSGYWIHHNLIRLNKHGVELGSSGAATSRLDHNCMQENRFAVANQREELTDAVIESNVTFRTFAAAYEIGWGLAGTKDVNLRHNQSIEDNRAYVVEESQDTNLYDNTVSRARDVGVEILGGNEDVRVSGNTIAAGGANFIGGSGIALRAPRTSFPQQPSTDVLVASNTITGFRTAGNAGFGMNVNSGSTAGATIVDNVLSGNGVAGLQVGNRNTGSLIRGNVASDNAQFGIRVMATAIDNTFVDNQMSGNATDARDDTDANLADGVQLLNRWTGNQCLSDIPVGAICGVA